MKSSPTVFVIGATGYIGYALFARAKKDGDAFGTSSSDKKGMLTLCLEAPYNFDYSKINRGDVIFLTAAISAPDICAREHHRAWGVNVTGTSAFISKAIERGARVIFFSSDTVYGEQEIEFNENMKCSPAGEYAVMKHEVEQRFLGNPSFKSIRLSYVFSREDKFSRYLLECANKKEEADLFHPFYRAIVHRDDVVEGALNLALHWDEVPEQIVNFGGPQILSRIDFADCLRQVHIHDLQFKVTEPGGEFFKNRPRIIAMQSTILARLLGRTLCTLYEASRIEFSLNAIKQKLHD